MKDNQIGSWLEDQFINHYSYCIFIYKRIVKDNRIRRKQEQRRRVEAEREHRESPLNDVPPPHQRGAGRRGGGGGGVGVLNGIHSNHDYELGSGRNRQTNSRQGCI